MKSYTDLEQSKILAEILQIESADMWYQHVGYSYSIIDGKEKPVYFPMVIRDNISSDDIPCWSLASLLDILTEQDFIIKTIGNEFNIDIPIRHCKIWFSSLLDAAFEMVCWLKENDKN